MVSIGSFHQQGINMSKEWGNLINPFNTREIFEQVLFSFDCWLFKLYENKTCLKIFLITLKQKLNDQQLPLQSQSSVYPKDFATQINLCVIGLHFALIWFWPLLNCKGILNFMNSTHHTVLEQHSNLKIRCLSSFTVMSSLIYCTCWINEVLNSLAM